MAKIMKLFKTVRAFLTTYKLPASALATFSFILLLPVSTQAQTLISPNYQTAMLELYTSQGCSSCPPAERWISGFTDDAKFWKEIIPINFRVDYWDYLGWEDHYSDPAFSSRQRRYQQLGHSRTVATPGFIINGKGWHGWFYNKPLRAENLNNAGVITIKLDRLDDQYHANLTFDKPSSINEPLVANFAIMGFGLEDKITRGENRGKTFIQDFVVLTHSKEILRSDDEQHTATSYLPDVSKHQAKQLAVVAWISKAADPSPIQAVGDWLENKEK